MKVFTVGLDEKPPIKEHPAPESVNVVPPPMIAVEKRIKKSYKGYMICFATMFCILIFAIVLSEIAYSRARDESFLRLRWAELRHRMGMGCSDCAHQRIVESLYRPNYMDSFPPKEALNEISSQSTQSLTTPAQPIKDALKESKIQDPRFEFLRQILTTIRDQAEKAGLDGTMRVSVIRIDPMEEIQDNSISDGFGEVFQPPQVRFPSDFQTARTADRLFNSWPVDDYYNGNEDSQQMIDVTTNRRIDVAPQANGPKIEAFPNSIDSSNTFGNSVLPWQNNFNQAQKNFETLQSVQQQQPQQQQQQQQQQLQLQHMHQQLQQQQWALNGPRSNEQWQTLPAQNSIFPLNQWYATTQGQWQNFNPAAPVWQWQGNQWQPFTNQWNQWQNGLQTSGQQQGAFLWPPQSAAQSFSNDNRWQASLQNNEWNIQKANVANSEQSVPSNPTNGASWWNLDRLNSEGVQSPQESSVPSIIQSLNSFASSQVMQPAQQANAQKV